MARVYGADNSALVNFEKLPWEDWLKAEYTYEVVAGEDFGCHPDLFIAELVHRAYLKELEVQALVHDDKVYFRFYIDHEDL